MTVSPSPSATRGCVSSAMRASALRGSPWLPVTRISRLSSGTIVDVVLRQERRHDPSDSRTPAPRRPCCASERPTSATLRPASRAASAIDLHARDVAGEAGHRDAAAQAADQRRQAVADVRLAAGMALDHRIGGIADHRQHALARRAPPSAASSVGGPTSGCGSSFQSPVCSTMPYGVSITSACASGIECATRMKRSANGARSIVPPGGMTCSLHLVEQPHLGQLAPQHGGGERRGIDRAAQLRPQPGDRADMVLMRMGDHQARPAGRGARR